MLNLIFLRQFLHDSRIFVGEFFETVHFQLLSGIKFRWGHKVYGPIYLSIVLLISTIAFVVTNIKKLNERYKEWKLHQNINMNQIVLATMKYNLDMNIQQPSPGIKKYNSIKNNVSLLSGFEIAVLVGFILAMCGIIFLLNMTTNTTEHFYIQFVIKEFTLVSFYNIVCPVVYLIKKKKMRKYFWEYTTDVMC